MPRRTPRQERILRLARELFAEEQRLPLDTIDGEFYWRICQEPVAELLHTFQWPPAPVLDETDRSPETFRVRGEHLMARYEAWYAFEQAHAALLAPVASPSMGYLLAGGRVPMRPPLIWQERSYPRFPDTDVLVMHIHSGEWKGYHVAGAILRELDADPFLAAQQQKHLDERARRLEWETHEFHLFAKLHRDAASMTAAGRRDAGVTTFPLIELALPLPLSDPTIVGVHYDLSVRSQRWHEVLPGGIPARQEKTVAIRTWAVGLLQASGMPFFDAMWEVAELSDQQPRSQTRYSKDRSHLLKRVPEARPYVFALR